jgi:hypothetical protein
MLLRRITEHVKAQNWTAIALDFVIVVVGVFIGIQVSNWNAEQQRKATARIIEVRLIGDLRNEIGVIENRIENYADVLITAKGLAAALEGPKESLGPEFLRDALFATVLWRFRRTQDTYDELITSGELGLIADPKVRSELSRYYRDLNAVVGIWDKPSNLRTLVRRHMPAEIQQQIRQNCYLWSDGEYEKIHFALISDCQLQITDSNLRVSIDALLNPNTIGPQNFSIANNELIADVNFKINTLKRKRDTALDLLAMMEAQQ